jgi:chemotaxis response regulator CheB
LQLVFKLLIDKIVMMEVTHPIIVIGSSAASWETLPLVLQNLSADMPPSVFIVQPFSSDTIGLSFLKHLANYSVLPCSFALDGEPIQQAGFILHRLTST